MRVIAQDSYFVPSARVLRGMDPPKKRKTSLWSGRWTGKQWLGCCIFVFSISGHSVLAIVAVNAVQARQL